MTQQEDHHVNLSLISDSYFPSISQTIIEENESISPGNVDILTEEEISLVPSLFTDLLLLAFVPAVNRSVSIC